MPPWGNQDAVIGQNALKGLNELFLTKGSLLPINLVWGHLEKGDKDKNISSAEPKEVKETGVVSTGTTREVQMAKTIARKRFYVNQASPERKHLAKIQSLCTRLRSPDST